jgi:hypothetical protein
MGDLNGDVILPGPGTRIDQVDNTTIRHRSTRKLIDWDCPPTPLTPSHWNCPPTPTHAIKLGNCPPTPTHADTDSRHQPGGLSADTDSHHQTGGLSADTVSPTYAAQQDLKEAQVFLALWHPVVLSSFPLVIVFHCFLVFFSSCFLSLFSLAVFSRFVFFRSNCNPVLRSNSRLCRHQVIK